MFWDAEATRVPLETAEKKDIYGNSVIMTGQVDKHKDEKKSKYKKTSR